MTDHIDGSTSNEESLSRNNTNPSENSQSGVDGDIILNNNNGSANQMENVPLDLTSALVPTNGEQGRLNTIPNTRTSIMSNDRTMLPVVSTNDRNVQPLYRNSQPSTSSSLTHSFPGIESNGSHMSFKSALDFLPQFYDGQNIPISKFARDCLFAQESIVERERPLLLRMIRSRLRGDADLYLQDQEINSLEDLLNDLKAAFSPHENVQDLTAMLSTVTQKTEETAEKYGVCVRKILNRLVTAIEHDNAPEISFGMIHAARASAIVNFLRGLKGDLELRVRIKNPKAAEWGVAYQKGLRFDNILTDNEETKKILKLHLTFKTDLILEKTDIPSSKYN
ncbi:uncharacterized protein [Venturia canescens]|uniref:uncharacterized protein n=1 Tax=Venturia canescens TaxID=32260 RepID=UPI001C9C0124|nr:uncharacterized protein LOC122414897 [Venturia canescens]